MNPQRWYADLSQLRAAYTTGELNPDTPLVLDNDCSYVYVDGRCVYRGEGYALREEALNLLAIPWENA